jgi:hypothetical protein
MEARDYPCCFFIRIRPLLEFVAFVNWSVAFKKCKMNKHGLSRTIPEEVKRQIRINSGFGCVICGMGIIEYEHVEPEYNEAKTHDPSKMTLLCAGCHGNVTRGLWSKEKVKRAMANPKALSQGFSNGFYDIGYEHPQVHFAGSKFVNSQIPIMIGGIPIIQINPPTEENGYFLLSAIFNDKRYEYFKNN